MKNPDIESNKNTDLRLNAEERKLISHIRDLNCGELRIVIQNGKLVRIEEPKKSIQL